MAPEQSRNKRTHTMGLKGQRDQLDVPVAQDRLMPSSRQHLIKGCIQLAVGHPLGMNHPQVWQA